MPAPSPLTVVPFLMSYYNSPSICAANFQYIVHVSTPGHPRAFAHNPQPSPTRNIPPQLVLPRTRAPFFLHHPASGRTTTYTRPSYMR